MKTCNCCCTRPATREAVLRTATWERLCDACFATSREKESYVPPDGRAIPQGAING